MPPKGKKPAAKEPPPAAQRICGTRGCTLPDFHSGLCNSVQLEAKRPRVCVAVTAPPERADGAPPVKRRAYVRRKSLGAPAAPAPVVPAVQELMPSGLRKFYDAQRWGVPLPDGPVSIEPDPPVDGEWRLEQTKWRICARDGVADPDAALMLLWNAYVDARSLPLVSDRMLPEACRQFAREHAADISAELREPFVRHLFVLWEHNLLHRDDVHDCLVIVGAEPAEAANPELFCPDCARPVHEARCALASKPRGAAAWPCGGGEDHAAAALPGGLWEPATARAPRGRRG